MRLRLRRKWVKRNSKRVTLSVSCLDSAVECQCDHTIAVVVAADVVGVVAIKEFVGAVAAAADGDDDGDEDEEMGYHIQMSQTTEE